MPKFHKLDRQQPIGIVLSVQVFVLVCTLKGIHGGCKIAIKFFLSARGIQGGQKVQPKNPKVSEKYCIWAKNEFLPAVALGAVCLGEGFLCMYVRT